MQEPSVASSAITLRVESPNSKEKTMRSIILLLLGVPIPIVILIALLSH